MANKEIELIEGMMFVIPAHLGIKKFGIYNFRREKLKLLEVEKYVLNFNTPITYDDGGNVIGIEKVKEFIESGYWKLCDK